MWHGRTNITHIDGGRNTPSKRANSNIATAPSSTGSHDNANILDIEKQPMLDRQESSSSSSAIILPSENQIMSRISPVKTTTNDATPADTAITSAGLKVLILLAGQNCFKNLFMRYLMKDHPKFLTSAAVIGVETIKLVLSTMYIVFVDKRPVSSILTFMKEDHRNSMLLAVPAASYSFQMSMEYVALANLDAAVFSVLVQSKLLTTATFAALVLGKKLKYIQVISLILLTAGVMLCNLMAYFNKQQQGNVNVGPDEGTLDAQQLTGIAATLGIAASSGFASVYTEKVIKAKRNQNVMRKNYSLAYMQVQLAVVSLVIIGLYATIIDYDKIVQGGLWQNFSFGATFSMFNSAIGGLIVAAALKYADSVLKGYATAMSVVLTGVLSMFLFGTQLNVIYFLGVVNVIAAVLLYNGKNLDKYVC